MALHERRNFSNLEMLPILVLPASKAEGVERASSLPACDETKEVRRLTGL